MTNTTSIIVVCAACICVAGLVVGLGRMTGPTAAADRPVAAGAAMPAETPAVVMRAWLAAWQDRDAVRLADILMPDAVVAGLPAGRWIDGVLARPPGAVLSLDKADAAVDAVRGSALLIAGISMTRGDAPPLRAKQAVAFALDGGRWRIAAVVGQTE